MDKHVIAVEDTTFSPTAMHTEATVFFSDGTCSFDVDGCIVKSDIPVDKDFFDMISKKFASTGEIVVL